MRKKELVAMILAGGKGTRLKNLTKNIAKPAVHYGGKYRIIDFCLSNCSNSGIDTVGVLTQYEPFILNTYIGNGSPWDLDRKRGGIFVLPPFVGYKGDKRWYSATANAVFQNINFLDKYRPENVIILSGDHIYKMDYYEMLKYHQEKKADITVSVISVPWDEASRFGIMNVNKGNNIIEFEEKPNEPKSNLASMGVYIFKWDVLKNYLIKDNKKEKSSHDFGKDLIPLMLKDKKKLFAYPFEGYWRDVGTIKSLWQANMDLLDDNSQLNLYDSNWRIYSRNPNQPVQYIGPKAKLNRALVNEGCIVYGNLEKSILFYGTYVGDNSLISNSVIMPNTRIGNNVKINNAIIGENMVIEDNAVIGNFEEDNDEIVLFEDGEEISE